MGGTPISHRQKLRSSVSLEERVCGLCAERSIDVKNVAKCKDSLKQIYLRKTVLAFGMGGTPISHRQKLRSSASLEERVCGLCAERSIDVKNVAKCKNSLKQIYL